VKASRVEMIQGASRAVLFCPPASIHADVLFACSGILVVFPRYALFALFVVGRTAVEM